MDKDTEMNRGLKVIVAIALITCIILLAIKGLLYIFPSVNETLITTIGIFGAGFLGALFGRCILK